MTTKNEIKAAILYLKNAFPNYYPVLDGEHNTVDVLLDLLGDLDSSIFWMALKSCCAEARQFAPSAGEIRAKAAELAGRASGLPDAVEAWGAVMDYLRSRRVSPAFEHPVTQKVVQAMGGTTVLGLSENNVADRAHFLKMFEQTATSALREVSDLPQVSGYIEAQLEKVAGKLSDGRDTE